MNGWMITEKATIDDEKAMTGSNPRMDICEKK